MSSAFSGWREGARRILVLTALALFFGLLQWYIAAGVFLFGAIFTLFFFRDPNRIITAEGLELASPADGTVVAIDDLEESPFYDGPCKRIAIFLSVLNVHINRVPFDGCITKVEYRPGKFINAMNPECSKVNESNAVVFETARGPITVRQISGAIARRIVCVPKTGDTLLRGDRFGMIKFGSRTELFVPKNTEICVTMKQKVRGGHTIIARFNDQCEEST